MPKLTIDLAEAALEKRRKKLPFRFDYSYPSVWQQRFQKCYNLLFDTVYPLRPWAFGVLWSSASAYFYATASSRQCYAILAGAFVSGATLIALRLFLRLFIFRYKRFLFESRPSLVTRFWQVCFYVLRELAPPRLRSCDSLLPKLSVPDLRATTSRYLDSMRPLVEKDEFSQLERDAEQFLANEGPKLHRQAWLYSWFTRNYVTPFWEKYAYLSRRENLIVNSSICCADCWGTPKCNQPTRAAHIVYLSALNMMSFADQSQRPLADGLIFSGHYNRLYCNSRVPGLECDTWNPRDYTRHFVCYANGCFYKVQLFDPQTHKLYTIEELTDILTELLKRDDRSSETERKLAALTQDRRDGWAVSREKFFLKNELNRRFLHEIETAMVFLVLDEADNYGYEDSNYDQLANFIKNMLTGNGMNRWTDKPINFIVGKNGRAGACSEHSVADGPEYFHITENKFFADLIVGFPEKVVDIDSLRDFRAASHLKLAERMQVEIVEEMESKIEECYETATQLINDTDISRI